MPVWKGTRRGANLSRVKREKEERSFSTASSVAGVGSLRSIWEPCQKAMGPGHHEDVAHPNVVDLHNCSYSRQGAVALPGTLPAELRTTLRPGDDVNSSVSGEARSIVFQKMIARKAAKYLDTAKDGKATCEHKTVCSGRC